VLGRRLLVLLLGAMVLSPVQGLAAADADGPSLPERQDAVASFAYVEPVRRDGGVGYVVRVYGSPPVGQVKVRVREAKEGEGKGILLFGSVKGQRAPVRAEVLGRALPGPGPDGRRWPLFFAEPPPRGARDREFRVDLAVNGTISIQRLTVSALDQRWQTSSKRISLVGRGEAVLPPLPFKEAQEQSWLAESLLGGRSAIVAVTGLLLAGLALAVHWAPREGGVERPSPEQRGTEGRGLLVMLIVVVAASGAMLLRHFVER